VQFFTSPHRATVVLVTTLASSSSLRAPRFLRAIASPIFIHMALDSAKSTVPISSFVLVHKPHPPQFHG
jgi:hypothetical protein